ncbi:MAG: response regulator [Planctomycetes bacterium]|nr:response regulator [Planctomycetota bacterium]
MEPGNDPLDGTILIVDDLDFSVRLLSKWLADAGYRHVHATRDSREAATMCRDVGADCVLLDINMPHLDGFQVMEDLKAMSPGNPVPVLVLTGEDGQEVLARAFLAGAKDFISKPFTKIQVLARVHNMVETRQLHNQVRAQNLVLEDHVKERTRQLSESRLELVQRLARTAEYRDSDTGNHITRMSRYCERLAQVAGLAAEESELILNASPMHDLGKVAIPDRILRKPGRLTPEEWTVMQTHAQIGADLLSGGTSDLMRLAEVIALSHHERWDGTGYPRCIAGDEIPQPARIAAVCDVFDALTSPRPYKKAWTHEAARAEIVKGSGFHFEPRLVELFVENFADFIGIQQQLQS